MNNTTNETNVEETGATATEETTESISMSKDDYEKALQSAEDKVRSKLHKQIKDLEARLAALEVPEKSNEEIALESRVAEIEAREKFVALKEDLHSKNLDRSFANFLKDGTDIDAFNVLIEKVTTDKVKSQGYVPSGHQNTQSVSLGDWHKMNYAEKAKFRDSHPEIAEGFLKRFKN